MNFTYLCIYHIERLQACEAEAWRTWSQMMQRGVKAYADCRTEAAHIYLNTALEVALLRNACCETNVSFGELELLKPAEFLIQLYVIEDAFDSALDVLARISSAESSGNFGTAVRKFLALQYKRVELAEQAFFGRGRSSIPANAAVQHYLH